MTRRKQRARRGEIGLVRLRSGCWGIRWGRALARDLGVPPLESAGTPDRVEAERFLHKRELDVAELRCDRARADTLRRVTPIIPIETLVSDFLRAFAGGELRGAKPKASTVDGYIAHLLGARGGLVAFACSLGRTTSDRFDGVLIERWLESERGRAANDTLRLKLIAARRLAEFGVDRALVTKERGAAVRALRPPAASRGRARADGVPSESEVGALLRAMSPSYWRAVAELQLRLGLRKGEVLAISADWIDEAAATVHVRVGDNFDTKNHASRTVDGVDPATLALAHHVIALKAKRELSASGYREAWDRALGRLARAGTLWPYRNKTHALRAAYATESRLAGVPLTVVRDRMGHESERTTERHYLGRTREVVAGPFAGRPSLTPCAESSATAAAGTHRKSNVIPFRRPA